MIEHVFTLLLLLLVLGLYYDHRQLRKDFEEESTRERNLRDLKIKEEGKIRREQLRTLRQRIYRLDRELKREKEYPWLV